MPNWAWWAVLALGLAVGEMLTLGLFLGPLALAALVAGVVALGAPVWAQLLVFVVSSVASLGLLRPLARSHLRTPGALRTGTSALVGARALVVERVDASGGKVKIGGEIWSARTYLEDHVIEVGARVDVLEIEGATALVSE